MKKIISIILGVALIMAFMLTCSVEANASNWQFFDTTYQFDRVQIAMPDGSTIVGDVDSWKDFEASDMIQVKVNGKTYLTHSMNVVLIAE